MHKNKSMQTTSLFSLQKMPFELPSVKIKSSKNIDLFVRNFWHSDIEIYESMFMITLNNANDTTGFMKISQGGVSGTVVDFKIIAKYAIENLATGVVICHNHPSGNLKPSGADKYMTEKLKKALGLFDIKLIDHLIITAESYFSFSDSGKL